MFVPSSTVLIHSRRGLNYVVHWRLFKQSLCSRGTVGKDKGALVLLKKPQEKGQNPFASISQKLIISNIT